MPLSIRRRIGLSSPFDPVQSKYTGCTALKENVAEESKVYGDMRRSRSGFTQ
jgi:hypothetical protein